MHRHGIKTKPVRAMQLKLIGQQRLYTTVRIQSHIRTDLKQIQGGTRLEAGIPSLEDPDSEQKLIILIIKCTGMRYIVKSFC